MSGHKTQGAGQPVYFKCAKCRLTRNAGIGGAELNRQTLTGRTRGPYGNRGQRMDKFAREYKCDCGHTGWSRHVDLARKAALPVPYPVGTGGI
jgi:hypothetical protein